MGNTVVACVYLWYACMWVCVSVCVFAGVHACAFGSQKWMLSVFLRQGIMMNPPLVDLGSLDNWFALGFCRLSTGITGGYHTFLAFMWALGMKIPALTPVC